MAGATVSGHLLPHALQQSQGDLIGNFATQRARPPIDFTAGRPGVDGLGQRRLSTMVSASPYAVIMMIGTFSRIVLALGRNSSPLIPRHIDV